MSRRSRRGSRRDKGKVAGWIYGGIGLVIIALIVGAAMVMNMGIRPTDRTTACPTDHYDTVTAVLVDLTDKVRATPAEALRNALLKIRNDVPRYGRLEIYPLTSTAVHTIGPLFAGCNPGSARDVYSRVFGKGQPLLIFRSVGQLPVFDPDAVCGDYELENAFRLALRSRPATREFIASALRFDLLRELRQLPFQVFVIVRMDLL